MARHIAAAALLAALAGCAGGKGASSDTAVAHVGQPAPSWSERTSSGATLTQASLRGKAVYLNFFATWCPPCNEEAPSINELQQTYGSRGLQVVGVDVLEPAAKAALFRAEHHLIYPVLVDGGTLRRQYEVNALPVHVFIDRRGVVRKVIVGELSAASMRSDVEGILE